MSIRHRLIVHALMAGLVRTAWADPQSSAYGPLPAEALALPAEFGMLIGIDTAALFASAEYKGLRSGEVLGAGLSEQQKAEMKDGIAKGLKEIEDETGVNPERDLDRFVMGMTGFEDNEPTLAMLLLGRFDAARISRAVDAAAKDKSAVTRQPLHGQTVLVVTKDGKPEAASVVIDGKCLIFGSRSAVEATLASWVQGRRTLAANSSTMDLVKGLDPASSLWLVLGPSATAAMRKKAGPKPPPFPIPDTWTMAGRLDGGFESVAEMADEATARNLADLIRGGLAAVKMQVAQNADGAKVPGMAAAFEAMQVTTQGRRVVLSSAQGAGGTTAFGVMAAIAIPSLLRARVSANEAATIGDTRTVISAEAAYESAAQGYADLSCLAEPASCLKGYEGPYFLDKPLASATQKSGYKRTFHPGPAGQKAGTYKAFAYVSTPLEPGKTGVRSFCGDSSGRVCFDAKGAAIVPKDGLCPASCTDLH